MTQLVVFLAATVFAGFFLWVWFRGLSPLSRVRSEARKRRWSLEEDTDGLWYRLKGNNSGMTWFAEWNGRELRPYLELSVADAPLFNGWCFISPRERDWAEPPRFLAGAFAGKMQPEWFVEWMHAKVISTGHPELDLEFIVAASSPGVGKQLPLRLLEKLRELPSGLLSNVFVIRGKQKLVLHVEETGKVDALILIERLRVLAQQVLLESR